MTYIDQKEVYKETNNGLDVFKYYFPEVDFSNPRHVFKIRKNEKTASSKVSWYKGLYRITDFGNLDKVKGIDCIDFVKYQESLVYIDALKFIQEVIVGRTINSGDFKKPQYRPEYSFREMEKTDKKRNYNFTYKEKPTERELHSIGRYVTAELLEKFHCRSVEKYEYCSHSKKLKRDVVHIFKATEHYPIFIFDFGKFKKLYRPLDQEKKNRFLYIGEKPKNYIYGLEQLEEVDNEFNDEDGNYAYNGHDKDYKQPHIKDLIRCSGESDALNVASLNFHVYWLNSETADLDYEQYTKLDNMCENHYQVMDMDETGREAGKKLALQHINLFTIELPKYLWSKKDWRGSHCKDVKDYINIYGKDWDGTLRKFLVLKRRAKPAKFWIKSIVEKNGTKNVNYTINLEFFYYFLMLHGFYTMDSKYHKRAGYCYARIKGKVVELIHPDDMKKMVKRFTKEWIRSKNLMDEIAILNKINASNQITESDLSDNLEQIDPKFKNYASNYETLIFKNTAFKITKDSFERIKHEELPNYILSNLEINNKKISHLIDHNITYIKNSLVEVKASTHYQDLMDQLAKVKNSDQRQEINIKIDQIPDIDKYEININDKDFIFLQYLRDTSRIHWRKELEKKQELTADEKKEEKLLLINLLFTIGFMSSQYKDPGKPWLVLLQDMLISQVGKSSGRSGKSLLTQALGFVRPSFYIGGRKPNLVENQFIYDGLTKFHSIIEVDDMDEYVPFNFFYTQITGKREVNAKHISSEILEYPESSKMIISTNFELHNTDSSTIDRILNCGISDYYHAKTKYNDYQESRTPLLKFGRRLYDDFTDDEWNKFFNLIAYCIQLTQRFFKIMPPMDSLEKRQLRREMTRGVGKGEEFWIWANSFFVEKPTDLNEDISPDEHGYLDCYIVKRIAMEKFKESLTSAQANKYKSTQFKTSVQAYCEYYGYVFNPLYLCNGDANRGFRRITETLDGKTEECFYIASKKGEMLTPKEEDDLPF